MRGTAGLVHYFLPCCSFVQHVNIGQGMVVVCFLRASSNVKLDASMFNVHRYFNEPSVLLLQSAKAPQ